MLKKFLTALFLGLIILCPLATLAVEDSVPVETGNSSYTGDCPEGKLCLNVPIGGLSQLDAKDSSVLGKYLTVWYNLVIGAVGVLATVMVMYGGFKWLTSRGNSGEVGQAKEIITSAIIGMILAFLSFTILYLVNPRLTRIEMPKLGQAKANLTGSLPSSQLPQEAMQQAKLAVDQLAVESNSNPSVTNYRHVDGSDPEHSFETYQLANTPELERVLRDQATQGNATITEINGRAAFVYNGSAYNWNDNGQWTVITPDINILYTFNNNNEVRDYFNDLYSNI